MGGKVRMEAFSNEPCGSEHIRKIIDLAQAMNALTELVTVATAKFIFESDHVESQHTVIEAGLAFTKASQVVIGRLSAIRHSLTMGAFYEAMFVVSERLLPTMENLEKLLGDDLRTDEGYPSVLIRELIAS